MRLLTGTVAGRFGIAGPNLATIEPLLLQRTGLPSMARGTLNVFLKEQYLVSADAEIAPSEYKDNERLKLQKCRVRGVAMWIMRPSGHEPGEGAKTLELISHLKLREAFGLSDGDPLEVEVEGDSAWWTAPDTDPQG